MSEFDPAKPAMVHERINDRTFEWDPAEWEVSYLRYAREMEPGVISFSGWHLDGWQPLEPPR